MIGSVGTLIALPGAGLLRQRVLIAYLGFGVLGGTGAGIVYATCVNMVGKWYPERKGGKTGFVNGGFAYGSVPFIFIFSNYMDVENYGGILLAVGIFLAIGVAASGWFFKDPPKNWWPAHVDPLTVSEDPRIRRSLAEEPARDQAVHAEGGHQYAGVLSADVVLSCSARRASTSSASPCRCRSARRWASRAASWRWR